MEPKHVLIASGIAVGSLLLLSKPVEPQCIEGDSWCDGDDRYTCIDGLPVLTGPGACIVNPAFQLSDLLTIPNPVELGRLVSARVTVTNNGTAAGSYEFTLIRPAPLTAVVWSGSLAVGGSRLHSVAWNAGIQEGIGTHSISIDGLTASYTVYEEAPPPVTGEITSMDAPLEATVGVPITVTVYYKNTSAVSIVGAIKLTVGSSTFTSPDAVVASGGTHSEPFTITFAEQGQHTITAQLLGE